MNRLKMPRPIPVLKGEMVLLRPPDPVQDAREYFEMNRDPDMHVWSDNEMFSTEADALAKLEEYLVNPVLSTWMIIDRESGKLAGRFFLSMVDRNGRRVVAEGNRIAREFRRKGHNSEARQLLFRYVFERLHADIYETGAWAGNTVSLKSIESYGFKFDRDVQKWNKKHGKEMIMRCYRMTRKQWQRSVL